MMSFVFHFFGFSGNEGRLSRYGDVRELEREMMNRKDRLEILMQFVILIDQKLKEF